MTNYLARLSTAAFSRRRWFHLARRSTSAKESAIRLPVVGGHGRHSLTARLGAAQKTGHRSRADFLSQDRSRRPSCRCRRSRHRLRRRHCRHQGGRKRHECSHHRRASAQRMAARHAGIAQRAQTTRRQADRLSCADHGDRGARQMDGAALQDHAQLDDCSGLGCARRSVDARPTRRDAG